MPDPDDELASAPVWLASTIEPWIEQTRVSLAREGAPAVRELTPALAQQAARRLGRVWVLLLEQPRREGAITRAAHGLGALIPALADALADAEVPPVGLVEVLDVARKAQAKAAEGALSEAPVLDGFTRDINDVLPVAARMVSTFL